MSERYSKLFALPENLYAAGSPVVIAAGALLKDNQTGKVIAQLKMRNISQKPIKAAKVSIHPLDTVGNPLGEKIEYQYLDLSAARDEDFGQKAPVALADASTRSFTASVEEIVFADNSIWTPTGEPWEVLDTPGSLRSIGDAELIKQYRLKYGNNCKNLPLLHKDLWYCACGELNRQGEAECHRCQKSLALLEQLDMDVLRKERDTRVAAEKEQAEKEAAAAKAHAKKMGKIAAIVVPILVVLIVAAVIISNSVEKSNAYENALALLDAGQYAEAIEAFTALDGYKDSVEKIEYAEQEKEYSEAVSLLANKKFSEAIIAFESMDGYRDSIQQVYESKYLWALHCLEVSEDRNAYELLTELADLGYKESSTYLADFIYLPSAVTIADGKKILCDYDLHGNVICGLIKMKPDYSVFVLDTSYAFPNEIFMSYPVFDSIEYTYNEDGSFIRQYGFSVTSSTSIEYMDSFDAKGQCISRYRYFDIDDYGSSSVEYIFEYYDNGRYRKLSHLSDGEISWVREYEEDGTFTSTSYQFPSLNDNEKDTTDEYNNITCGDNNYQYTYDYDENGNLVHREVYQGNTKVMYTNYFYDEYGYLIRQEGTEWNGREYSDEFSYEYGYFYCPEAVE